MTKEKISHEEVQDALREFKGNGGVISMLPETTKNINFEHENETAGLRLCDDAKFNFLNKESGIESLPNLQSFFSLETT